MRQLCQKDLHTQNLPSSSVWIKYRWLKGPIPTDVFAATTHTYVVCGSSPVMLMNVEFVKYCTVSSVSACVTLMTY